MQVQLEGLAWERLFRAPTEGDLPPPQAESVGYQPLPWTLVRKALDGLALGPDDVFLDYGAGMGRALLMAARRGPRRVIGVELLETLVEGARHNMKTAARRLRCPVEVHVGDASTWVVPDDVTAVYLFNPFFGATMEQTLARLRESLERRPRRLKVLYARVSAEPDLFVTCSWLRLERHVDPGVFRALTIGVYASAESLARRDGLRL